MSYAIKVIYENGDEAYVCDGVDSNIPSRFVSRARAKITAIFLEEGAEEDFQSINVVRYPERSTAQGTPTNSSHKASDGGER